MHSSSGARDKSPLYFRPALVFGANHFQSRMRKEDSFIQEAQLASFNTKPTANSNSSLLELTGYIQTEDKRLDDLHVKPVLSKLRSQSQRRRAALPSLRDKHYQSYMIQEKSNQSKTGETSCMENTDY